jgi:type IV secretory pathway TraG/TraD family ATPase VirD4
MNIRPEEQLLLIEAKPLKCGQARYYSDKFFAKCGSRKLQSF